jgi:hypothetical protein
MSKTILTTKPDLSAMAEKWPSPLIARGEVRTFSGGLLSEKYLANLDSQGKGPGGRIRCGRKVCYRVDALIKWLENRAEAL